MNKARIQSTNEIVYAADLQELFPNYRDMVFVCLDEKCSVRMAPSCIVKNNRKKPHFKKYRNQDHIDSCEYAIIDELVQKGKGQKLNKTEVKKIGYPSVFDVKDEDDQTEKVPSQARPDNDNPGVTGRGGVTKVYEFDSENIKFDRSNKVQSIDRIVDWYLGFPYNRDVELEIHGEKIPYRYFFKRIGDFTDPAKLNYERIFYGIVKLSKSNNDIFDKYSGNVFINLLGFKDVSDTTGKPNNYSIRIDKKSMSKQMLARLRNKYNVLFEEAFEDLNNKTNDPYIHLFAFVYGQLDEKNDTLINVRKHHITFRYDEVRKTVIES